MSQASLSVCMIVRNEARMLPGCLNSLIGIADQIVIIDTGSEDDTAKIACSFGAQVYDFPWGDDFAAARNESIRHASEDWILWIDADERLLLNSIDFLKRSLVPVTRPTIYQIWIRNIQKDGKSYTLSMSHRLFSRHPGIKFSGRIHEQVHPSLKAVNGLEKPSEIMLEHHGYALEEDALNAKLMRNQSLLEAMVNEQPTSSYAHYTLGQNYALLGEHERALDAYQRAKEIGEFRGSSASTLLNAAAEACWQLSRLEEAETYAQESLVITPRQSSGNFIMYRISRSRENVKDQIEFLSNILSLSSKGSESILSDLPKDVMVPHEHLFFSLGQLYLNSGGFSDAANMLRECLAVEPKSREARELLALALAKQAQWEELLEVLLEIPQPYPDHLRELRGMALMKKQRYEEAITHYTAWLADMPENEQLRRRLAGLYGKLGDRETAERILLGDNLA
jgi:tetratricopeptide (TPR) repeat protein